MLKNKHPLPHISHIYSAMTSAYLQIPVAAESQHKLAIQHRGNTHVFQDMPFGLAPAGPFLQQTLRLIFADMVC